MLRQMRPFRSHIAFGVLLVLVAVMAMTFVFSPLVMRPLDFGWISAGLVALVVSVILVRRAELRAVAATTIVVLATVTASWLTNRVIEGPTNRVTIENETGQSAARLWVACAPTRIQDRLRMYGPDPYFYGRLPAGRSVELDYRDWASDTMWVWAAVFEDGSFACGHSEHSQSRDIHVQVTNTVDDSEAWWCLRFVSPTVPWPEEE